MKERRAHSAVIPTQRDLIEAPPGRTEWMPLLALSLYALALLVWSALAWRTDPTAVVHLTDRATLPTQAVLVILLYRLVRDPQTHPRRRLLWGCVTVARALTLLATLVAYVLWYDGLPHRGDTGDLIFGLSYAACILGFLMLFRDLGGSFARPFIWLDIATLTLSAGTTLWTFVMLPLLARDAHTTADVVATSTFAGGATVMIVLLALLLMRVSDWSVERGLWLLLGAMLLSFVTDLFWVADGMPDGVLDGVPYNFSYLLVDLLLVAAVTVTRRIRRRDLPGKFLDARSLVPALFVLVSLAALVGSHSPADPERMQRALILALVSAGLLALREFGTRREAPPRLLLVQRDDDSRLTELVHRSADGVAIVDEHGFVSYLSPAADRLLGSGGQAGSAFKVQQLLGPDNGELLAAFLQRLTDGETDLDGADFTLPLRDGAQRVVCVVGADHRANPRIRGLVLTVRDVTEARLAERAVQESARRERQVLSDDVHEGLAQDLAGIAMMLETVNLESSARTPGSATDALGSAVKETARLIARVRRLALRLSPLQVVRGSLVLALEQLAAEVARIDSVKVDLRMHLDDRVLSGAEADEIYQVVRDAMGCMVLSTGRTRISVELRRAADVLEVVVASDGLVPEHDEQCPAQDGLRRITHRVRRLRGALCIERAVGAPASVGVYLPLDGTRGPAALGATFGQLPAGRA